MTAVLQLPLRRWIEDVVLDVFTTMLAVDAKPSAGARARRSGPRISGAIGIIGEKVSGVLYLHLTQHLAERLAGLLLRVPEGATSDDAEVNDVVAEFSNMIGGQFKSTLCNSGTICAMSTPSIIRGSAFAIESNPRAWTDTFSFDCLGDLFAVELHLEPQDL